LADHDPGDRQRAPDELEGREPLAEDEPGQGHAEDRDQVAEDRRPAGAEPADGDVPPEEREHRPGDGQVGEGAPGAEVGGAERGPGSLGQRARDEEDAVRIANDNRYGLGATIFTRDVKKGERLARRIQSGACFVNGQVKSDPRLPFGGVKASGYGRELSVHGIREFVNAKTIWIK